MVASSVTKIRTTLFLGILIIFTVFLFSSRIFLQQMLKYKA